MVDKDDFDLYKYKNLENGEIYRIYCVEPIGINPFLTQLHVLTEEGYKRQLMASDHLDDACVGPIATEKEDPTKLSPTDQNVIKALYSEKP